MYGLFGILVVNDNIHTVTTDRMIVWQELDDKTLEGFLEDLREATHPDKIDLSVMLEFINSIECWCGKCN